jgi:hypothetical protein
MRRTRKWDFVKQEAIRLAKLGIAPVDIAKKTGVRRSTVQRWMAAGKLTDTRQGARGGRAPGVTRSTKPKDWAATVRREYQLDVTDEALVTSAEMALSMAIDPLQSTTTRLTAMGRFQSIVKQLALVAREGAADKPVAPPAPAEQARIQRVTKRPAVDPRRALMSVVK